VAADVATVTVVLVCSRLKLPISTTLAKTRIDCSLSILSFDYCANRNGALRLFAFFACAAMYRLDSLDEHYRDATHSQGETP